MELKTFVRQCSGLLTPEVLFSNLQTFLAAMNFDFFRYQITATHLRKLNLKEGFIISTFPSDWTAHYINNALYEVDPIMQTAEMRAEPFQWSDIANLTRLTPEQVRYLEELRSWGIRDGVAIPIYSAKGTAAYFGAGSRSLAHAVDSFDLSMLQFACNFTHKRYLELQGAFDAEIPVLTKREAEVLTWIAKAKSTSVIAEILGVTDHTIDTLTRRIYRKLDVGDRISAVLKAVGAGLITL